MLGKHPWEMVNSTNNNKTYSMFQMFICLVKLNYTDTNVVMFAFFYNM